MALLRRLVSHPSFERIKSIYNDHFPIQIHFVCADWIEEQIKQDQFAVFENDPTGQRRADTFMRSLCNHMEHEKNKYIADEQMSNIEEIIRSYNSQLPSKSLQMYLKIRDQITFLEQFFHNSNESDLVAYQADAQESLHINEMLNYATKQASHIKDMHNIFMLELKKLETLELNEKAAIDNILPDRADIDRCKQRLVEEYSSIKQILTTQIDKLSHVLKHNIGTLMNDITKVQCTVIYKPLAGFHKGQALAGNGAGHMENTIEEIQDWFIKLAQLMWMTRSLIESILKHSQMQKSVYSTYLIEITKMLQFLIESAFIVENHPPQVLKTHAQ